MDKIKETLENRYNINIGKIENAEMPNYLLVRFKSNDDIFNPSSTMEIHSIDFTRNEIEALIFYGG